jgi:GNAT superfamily N-acetyltransferase
LSVVIERRCAAQDEELFRLYSEVFGQELTESSRKRWRWQYLENPHVGSDGPEIWVAREGATLLGQYASMPVLLWWGGREVRGSWGMDVFLRPEARGRGVGAQLFGAWGDFVDVALGLGLTPSSLGLFRKLRYADVGPVPFYQKVLDVSAVTRRRLGPLLGPLAAPLIGAALSLRQREQSSAGADVRVVSITGFSSAYDTLWEHARGSFAMCVRRDAAYLNWKYVACPHVRYDLWEAQRAGQLCGYAVSRTAEHQGSTLGWILDVFANATDEGAQDALLGSVLAAFRARGVTRVQAFASSAALGSALRRRGFMRGPSPMQFCVRSRVPDGGALQDVARWHVTFGDSDMDR